MAKNLQDLRREAGYRSAKDFAAAMDIALSTYNRYENQPEAIPLKQAWAIADFLGCSIDMVVGREPVDAYAMRGDVQRAYEALSAQGRRMVGEFIEFAQLRDERAARRRQAAEDAKYEALARRYEAMLWQRADEGAGFGELVGLGSDAEQRDAFQSLLVEDAKSRRRVAIEEHCAGLREEMEQGYLDDEGKAWHFSEEEILLAVREESGRMEAEQAAKDEEVIGRIMDAYDRMRGDAPPASLPQAPIGHMGR